MTGDGFRGTTAGQGSYSADLFRFAGLHFLDPGSIPAASTNFLRRFGLLGVGGTACAPHALRRGMIAWEWNEAGGHARGLRICQPDPP